MKKNLKMFLLIAVCAMASCCLLYIREADEKQQIHSEKKEKEKCSYKTSFQRSYNCILFIYIPPETKMDIYNLVTFLTYYLTQRKEKLSLILLCLAVYPQISHL